MFIKLSNILENNIKNYKTEKKLEETGIVLSMSDGIAHYYSLTKIQTRVLVKFNKGNNIFHMHKRSVFSHTHSLVSSNTMQETKELYLNFLETQQNVENHSIHKMDYALSSLIDCQKAIETKGLLPKPNDEDNQDYYTHFTGFHGSHYDFINNIVGVHTLQTNSNIFFGFYESETFSGAPENWDFYGKEFIECFEITLIAENSSCYAKLLALTNICQGFILLEPEVNPYIILPLVFHFEDDFRMVVPKTFKDILTFLGDGGLDQENMDIKSFLLVHFYKKLNLIYPTLIKNDLCIAAILPLLNINGIDIFFIDNLQNFSLLEILQNDISNCREIYYAKNFLKLVLNRKFNNECNNKDISNLIIDYIFQIKLRTSEEFLANIYK